MREPDRPPKPWLTTFLDDHGLKGADETPGERRERSRRCRQEHKRSIQAPIHHLLAEPRTSVGAQTQVELRESILQSLDGFGQYEIADALCHTQPQNADGVGLFLGHGH